MEPEPNEVLILHFPLSLLSVPPSAAHCIPVFPPHQSPLADAERQLPVTLTLRAPSYVSSRSWLAVALVVLFFPARSFLRGYRLPFRRSPHPFSSPIPIRFSSKAPPRTMATYSSRFHRALRARSFFFSFPVAPPQETERTRFPSLPLTRGDSRHIYEVFYPQP